MAQLYLISRWRKTRENLFYHKNTHSCSVFPQWEARRRTQVPTANLQLGEGSGLPYSNADPSPRGEEIQSDIGQGLTQNFTPSMFTLVEVLFSQKSHPPSSNAVPLYRFCFYRPCTRCHGRGSPDEGQLAEVTREKGRSPQVSSALCAGFPAAELRGLLCSQAPLDQAVPPRLRPARKKTSRRGLQPSGMLQKTGQQPGFRQAGTGTVVPTAGGCHHSRRQPGLAPVTWSPPAPQQGCRKGFLPDPSR